jgi:hypothetical protein
MSIMGLIGVLASGFLGAIECTKEWSANIVVILKAWLSIRGPKVIRNISKVSYS